MSPERIGVNQNARANRQDLDSPNKTSGFADI
jgi:hypothetical protein